MKMKALNYLKPIDITSRLVQCIDDKCNNKNNNSSKMYSDTLMRSSQEILRSICRDVELYGDNAMGNGSSGSNVSSGSGKDDSGNKDDDDDGGSVIGDGGAQPAKEKEPKSKTIVVQVHGRAGGRGGGWGDPSPDPSVQAIKFVWNERQWIIQVIII